MHIFINDVHIRIANSPIDMDESVFNFIIDCNSDKITRANLIHHVWLKNATPDVIDKILKLLNSNISRHLLSVTITGDNVELLKSQFKSHFKILKAAGGVVKKGKNVLMIERLGKWDLPKGKIDKGETTEDAAIREIYEECGVRAELKKKICATWHTYTMKRRLILKKTTWYQLNLTDESAMAPQVEEDITSIKWMSPKEVFHALENSYSSVQFVMDLYYKMGKKNV